MPTTGNIRYEFGELQMGQTSVLNCAGEFDAVRGDWSRQVNDIGMTAWMDTAGAGFVDVGALWDRGAAVCVQFQNDVAAALARCQANGEQALAECQAIVAR
jgi:hypothetical protein